jgi:hypothetical protein
MEDRPIEQLAALAIGTVEEVSPAEIKVMLDPNAPQATALNTGVPTGFPRINGYVLIPNETGAVVGMVIWLGVERSAYPKRTGLKDFGLVDLPFPTRKMTVTPLGTLVAERQAYRLRRGVSAFPSVGDPVLLPTARQLKSIIEASSEADRRVTIGTSPLAADAAVTVNPDKLFGRHLAVLGNTGSGKSCTVAGLIRWSLEQAKRGRKDGGRPNARFIILDPNGEYPAAFADFPDVRKFEVPPARPGSASLRLPAWMWNSHEWSAFVEARSGVQRPILMRALRELRVTSSLANVHSEQGFYCTLKSYYRSLVADKARGAPAYVDKPGKNDFGQKLRSLADTLAEYAKVGSLSTHKSTVEGADAAVRRVATRRFRTFKDDKGKLVEYYEAFTTPDVDEVISALDACIEAIPEAKPDLRVNEDTPRSFVPADLASLTEQIAVEQGQSQYVDSMVLRMRMLLSDMRLSEVLTPKLVESLDDWLTAFVGGREAENGALAIINLSLVPSDVLHIAIAVLARVIFEAVQRYRRLNDVELPTVLVLEEAHYFIRAMKEQESETPNAAQMCRQTFERIAREGRKFGLGLVLSSQRPSELSPTVLAQCNTFLLHRIVNDRDQELVGKLVPDNLGGLLKDLPSLPSRQAILLGWATEIPTLVEITELPDDQRPQSSDPEFWDVWTGKKPRDIDWKRVAEDWTGGPVQESRTAPEKRVDPDVATDSLDDIPF